MSEARAVRIVQLNRRIGGLEITSPVLTPADGLNRRIGGLENPTPSPSGGNHLNRRIGGLEKER